MTDSPQLKRRAHERTKAARRRIRLVLVGDDGAEQERVLPLGVLPLAEKDIVSRPSPVGTGRSLEDHLAGVVSGSEVAFAVLWWLARRSDGETNLTWWEVLQQWPTGLTAGTDYRIEDATEPEDTPPEA